MLYGIWGTRRGDTLFLTPLWRLQFLMMPRRVCKLRLCSVSLIPLNKECIYCSLITPYLVSFKVKNHAWRFDLCQQLISSSYNKLHYNCSSLIGHRYLMSYEADILINHESTDAFTYLTWSIVLVDVDVDIDIVILYGWRKRSVLVWFNACPLPSIYIRKRNFQETQCMMDW